MKPTTSTQWKNDWRMIRAIAGKDIVDSIRNKNIISLLISSLFIILMYRALPLLETQGDTLNVFVYDAGESALVAFLENSRAVEIRTYTTEEKMLDALRHQDTPHLGLVIPAGFDQALENGQPLPLQGFVMNWLNAEQKSQLETAANNEFQRLLGQPIVLNTDGNTVYQTTEVGGLAVSAGMAIVFVIVTTGLTLIPSLMVEEKKDHTLETLLISPASSRHVVMGKALAGLVYCVLGAGLGVAVNAFILMHGWLALIAVVCGSLFAVSMGLLLGTFIEDRAQLVLWAWVFILPLFVPMIITLLADILPDWLVTVSKAVPTYSLLSLLRASFAQTFDWGAIGLHVLWMLTCTALVLGVLSWIIRRQQDLGFAGTFSLRTLFSPPATKPAQPHGAPRSQQPANSQSSSVRPRPALAQSQPGRSTPLKIIAAIASKDIREAIRNKVLLSIMLGVALVVANGLILPALLGLQNKPALVVYDPGRSTILSGLAGGETFRISYVKSLEDLEMYVSTSSEVALGLEIPEDFDQRAGSDEVIELNAIVVHWAKADEVNELVTFFDEAFTQAAWSQVDIQVSDNRVYPPAQADRQPLIIILTATIGLVTMGLIMVPLLIIEEKEAHTFETLLISPASFQQVITGKALAGITYCLVAGFTVLLLSNYLIVHWGLAIVAVVLIATLSVGIGILLGITAQSQTSLSVWAGPVMFLVIGASLVKFFDTSTWSPILVKVIDWVPTNSFIALLGLSMTRQLQWNAIWQNSLSIISLSIVIFALIGWMMRRMVR